MVKTNAMRLLETGGIEYNVPEYEVDEKTAAENRAAEQISFFDDASATASEEEKTAKERKRQEAVLEIRKKYGKNAMLKGMNFEQGATGKSRNKQIGGHKE